MNDRILKLLLKRSHLRMDNQHAAEDQQPEHDRRLERDATLEVHKEPRIIPQEPAAQPVHEITADQLGRRRHHRAGQEYKKRALDLQSPDHTHDYKHRESVDRQPRSVEESAVNEPAVLIDHGAPYRLIEPPGHAIDQEPFGICD